MISSAAELQEYLERDRVALGMQRERPRLFGDEIWKYQIYLRKTEYYETRKELFSRLRYYYYRFKYHRLGLSLGFSIPLHVCGPGLNLAHYGAIVISEVATIGSNCRIHSGVNIGVARGGAKAPQIGDNVFIGPGAKLFGEIVIGENVLIGANAVVNKSFSDGVTIAGVPAQVVKPRPR